MLQATTFQSGQMTKEDFANLQKEDDYCKKVKECLAQSPLRQNFRVKQDILLKLPEPVKGNLEDLQSRFPTLVLPAVLIPMVVDLEHKGP